MRAPVIATGLALRMLGREWRSGELGVLLLALTIAVASLTGVGFLVSRIGAAVDLQASTALAADLRLSSAQPVARSDYAEAHRRGLRTASVTSALSVVFHGNASQLTYLEAVTAGYPLRGDLVVANEPFAKGVTAHGVPGRGEVWPDSRLLASLGGHLGSQLSIGAATFRVTRVLISRPDQSATFAQLAPTLIMNAADLPATRLIQPGSRVTYAALFAGARASVAAFESWLRAHLKPGERLRDIRQTSPQVKDAVQRVGRFLSLASLVSVLLCAIAVAMSARQYVRRHLDAVALLKTIGASRALTLSVSLLQLLLIAIVASVAGSALGFLAQHWLLHAVRGLFSTALPPPGLAPVGLGFATAVAVLAGFALPPLLQLARVPAIRVLRRDVGPPPLRVLLAYGPAVVVIAGLIYWAVRDWSLFAGFVLGLAGFVLLLAAAGWLLVSAAGSLRATRVGIAWRYGLASLRRRRADTLVQIVAFGTGLMVLLLLGLVRHDLLANWRASLPADAPNYFFINIPPDKRTAFKGFLQARGAHLTRMLPMIRGRMTAIDGRPVESMHFTSGSAERFAEREQNITWTGRLGAGNRVIAGRWWGPGDEGKALVSVASEFQHALGLKVGDRLTFDIGGEPVEARVASVRKVKWDSLQPNFFIVFAPGMLKGVAGTYLTSAYFHPTQASVLAQLARRFPSVSIFDIDGLLAQVRSIVDKAAFAVQCVFLFTLFAGLIVLLAAVQASRDERRYESAVLRTLGASRGVVTRSVLAEFSLVGVLSGLLAALGASVGGYFVASRVLDLPYSFDVRVWIAGVVGGAVLVGASGWLATRSAVRRPPLRSLRA